MTSHFNFKITKEDIEVLSEYLNKYNILINSISVDEASKLSKKQVMYLNDKHLKLKALDAPKKQHKPKHKVPFWVQDWRGK